LTEATILPLFRPFDLVTGNALSMMTKRIPQLWRAVDLLRSRHALRATCGKQLWDCLIFPSTQVQ